jgi:hypothetical protein
MPLPSGESGDLSQWFFYAGVTDKRFVTESCYSQRLRCEYIDRLQDSTFL